MSRVPGQNGLSTVALAEFCNDWNEKVDKGRGQVNVEIIDPPRTDEAHWFSPDLLAELGDPQDAEFEEVEDES